MFLAPCLVSYCYFSVSFPRIEVASEELILCEFWHSWVLDSALWSTVLVEFLNLIVH